MIWFKHMTNASDGETLSYLEEEFGLEGYARWFKLMEVVAAKADAENFSAEYSEKKWSTFLRAKPKKLRMFLECLRNLGTINIEQNENIIRIEMPNLRKFKQKDLGRSRPSRNKVVATPPLEKEKEKEKETDSVKSVFETKYWEKIKATHPKRQNKKKAKQKWEQLTSAGFEPDAIIKYYFDKFVREDDWRGENYTKAFHTGDINSEDLKDWLNHKEPEQEESQGLTMEDLEKSIERQRQFKAEKTKQLQEQEQGGINGFF